MLCFASLSGRKVTAGAPGKPGGPKCLLSTGVKEPLWTPMPKSVPTLSLCLSRESQVKKIICFCNKLLLDPSFKSFLAFLKIKILLIL